MSVPNHAVRPFRRCFMAIALSSALLQSGALVAQESPYSQTVFFGDSLTDAGFFRPLLPASVRPVTGQFTTNPGWVWSQYLADFYGTRADPNGNGQTGPNYAAGGARVGINSTGALGPIPSLATQVNNYLTANGGVADPNALYSVWGGANDLFAITNGGAPAVPTISAAVGSELAIVTQLQNAGARYILVANVPDLGLTPAFRALGPAAQANGTALSVSYNNALFDGLAASGLRVIPIDAFNLIREIVASPTTYGISNVTGTACQPQITANSLTCNPTSYITPDAPETYAFADGVHPSTAGHRILGQYVVSVLEGPRQIAAMPHFSAAVGRTQADRVFDHHALIPQDDGMSWWFGVQGIDLKREDSAGSDGFGPGAIGGVDWRQGRWTYGLHAAFGGQEHDFSAAAGGGIEQRSLTLGGSASWRGEKAWVQAQVSHRQDDFDISRRIILGAANREHRGSTDGTSTLLGLRAGWEFGQGSVRHGPYIGYIMQNIEVDGFDESNPSLSTALGYAAQDADSRMLSVGWQVTLGVGRDVQPYASLSLNREGGDFAEEAFARSLSIAQQPEFAVPAPLFDDEFGTARLGFRAKVGGLMMDAGVSSSFNRQDGSENTFHVSLGKSF